MKKFLLFIICLCTISASCQKKDTIRIYRYEHLNRCKLTVKNKKYFTYISSFYNDTLKGVLTKQDGVYRLDMDTTLLNKYQKRDFAYINKNIWLQNNTVTNDLLMHISYDLIRWSYEDTTKLLDELPGLYVISDGFSGYEIKLEDKIIKFQPFSDVRGKEEIEAVPYMRDYQGIKLIGRSYISKWFTDNKRFIALPYILIGKKVKTNSKTYTEIYTYFIKESEWKE